MLGSIPTKKTLSLGNKPLIIPFQNSDGETVSPQTIPSRLTTILQTTLELDSLINFFINEAQQGIPCDGVCYHLDEMDGIIIKQGIEQGHKANYRLVIEDQYLGDISFYRLTRFSQDDLEYIEQLLIPLLYPLRNTLQYQLAVHTALKDALTGLSNRQAYDHSIGREIDMAGRHNMALSMLVIDVDHFKMINDTYGHASGDNILVCIAEQIQHCIRSCDLAFRYGGEEFVVLLNKTDSQGALLLAERMRQCVQWVDNKMGDKVFNATISIGIATLNADDNENSLFERADAALYQAKKSGRNCVCVN